MKRATVVHLSTVHHPRDIRIFHKEARTLQQAGYSVEIVAPGERDEVIEGIQIRALKGPNRGIRRFTQTNREAWRRACAYPQDVIFHLHDPELLFVGFALKRRGYRVIYDVHEDTPLWLLYQHWIPRLARRPLSRLFAYLEQRAVARLDGIVVATEPIQKRLRSPRTIVVRNLPLRAEFATDAGMPYAARAPLVVYVGTLTRLRGIQEMIQAVALLNEQGCPVTLHLGGAFHPPTLQQEMERLPGWQYVRYAGWQTREAVQQVLHRARVGLALIHPGKHYSHAYPTKLFEYMAAGIPVVASDLPLIREIVAPAEAGILVDPRDVRAIAEAIRWLLEHPGEAQAMGQRGRRLFLTSLHWEREAAKLLALYERVASPQS
ncbi:glycosyltransferase family 4 protein [Rhodothermus profundi]|uniref:Glycosyltransferase involved in cell wall bisynthesis n=1 Tax=Rhodothermus profundi TaxID=633813 RepID=A0A1M6Q8B2_9BACT|nr:glycosyltransferase family 4 protein [Rhodothermus profundi]SHK16323.1 Glycosyltransferase involved in cell wall bisynthesis [Rhodothermus profundi]